MAGDAGVADLVGEVSAMGGNGEEDALPRGRR
jgi:hypothetical protein